MAKCIHGDVCRAYMSRGARILEPNCPYCMFYRSAEPCPKCGKHQFDPRNKFCSHCGEKLGN